MNVHAPLPDQAGALAALISPLDVASFARDFWLRQPFLVEGPIGRLPPPLTESMLQDFALLSSRYSGRAVFGRGRKGPRSVLVDHVRPAELYNMGLSLYLPDIEDLLPGAAGFLQALESDLGLEAGAARMTAWASPGSDGIACHFDAEDVFSIQLIGAKRFYVAEDPALVHPVGSQFGPGIPPTPELYPQVREGFPDPQDFEFTEMLMNPGSVLFIPRGHWHRTEADVDSLSISVILSPPSRADVLLGRLRELLLQDPDWRRPAHGPDRRSDGDVTRLLKSLPQTLRAIRHTDLGPRHSATPCGAIAAESRFQPVPEMRLDVAGSPHGPTIQVSQWRAGAQVTVNPLVDDLAVDADYAPALDWLRSNRGAFSLGRLAMMFPGVEPSVHQRLVARLVSEGYLGQLTYLSMPDQS